MKKYVFVAAVLFSLSSFSQTELKGGIVDQNGNKIDTIDCAKMKNGDKYYFTVETKSNFFIPEYVDLIMKNNLNDDFTWKGMPQNSFSAAFSENTKAQFLIIEKSNDKYLNTNSNYQNKDLAKFCYYKEDCKVHLEVAGYSITGYEETYNNGQVTRTPKYGNKVDLGITKEFTVLTDKEYSQKWIKADEEANKNMAKAFKRYLIVGGIIGAGYVGWKVYSYLKK